MNLLIIGLLLPIILSPILGFYAERSPKLVKGFSLLISVTVVLLIVFHVIPDCYAVWGPVSVLLMVLGFAGTVLMHRFYDVRNLSQKRSLWILAGIAIGIHGLMDGVALIQPELGTVSFHHDELARGVILHRFVVSAFIWLSAGAVSKRLVWSFLGILGGASLVGYYIGGLMSDFSPKGFVLVESVVAGGVLHVVLEVIRFRKKEN